MRRTEEEFVREVYRREQAAHRRNARVWRILAACVPVVLLCLFLILPKPSESVPEQMPESGTVPMHTPETEAVLATAYITSATGSQRVLTDPGTLAALAKTLEQFLPGPAPEEAGSLLYTIQLEFPQGEPVTLTLTSQGLHTETEWRVGPVEALQKQLDDLWK